MVVGGRGCVARGGPLRLDSVLRRRSPVLHWRLLFRVIWLVARRGGLPNRGAQSSVRDRAIIAGTTIIVLMTWAVSIMKESRDLPDDMANRAIRSVRDIGSMTAAEFRQRAADDIRVHLREQYAPGGTIGYLRWVLASGRFQAGTFAWQSKELAFPQARYLFAVRVTLSIGLLAFGVASQTWLLHAVKRDDSRELPTR
jgi:hypothetical protein